MSMHIMVKKRCMWKSDACVGRETHINKLLLKKPPGLRSAGSASHNEPLRAIKGKSRGRQNKNRKKYICKNGQRKETNTEFGARHRIFGDVRRSMGSARVGCPTHLAGGTLRQLGLRRL